MRYPLSALDVSAFDSACFASKVALTDASGIRVAQMPLGWQHSLHHQTFIHDLDWQLMLDVPHHEARQKRTLSHFLAEEVLHPNSLPESYFIAWSQAEAVGMTCFVKRGESIKLLSTAITGVLKSHRRKGIATALKVASIQYAQTIGCQTILTNNEENNPMYLLNQQLGFRPRPAWLDVELKLS